MEDYERLVGHGTLLMAEAVIRRTEDQERRARMRRALDERCAELDCPHVRAAEALVARAVAPQQDDRKLAYLVDLAFSDVFGRYAIALERDRHGHALREVAAVVGTAPGTRDRLVEAAERAKTTYSFVHDNSALLKLGAVVATMAFVGSLAGGPGFELFGAEGLSGAAEMTSALDAMSLGNGIAGGIWVLTSASALAAGHRQKLLQSIVAQLGPTGLQRELMKLQTTLLVADRQPQELEATEDMLQVWRAQAETDLERARVLNDPGSQPIKDAKRVLWIIERTLDWLADPDEGSLRHQAAWGAQRTAGAINDTRIGARRLARGLRDRALARLEEHGIASCDPASGREGPDSAPTSV